VREPRKLAARSWTADPRVQIVKADIEDTDALAEAMRGCDAAYYLVHSMESGTTDFASRDHDLANSFARAAATAGVGRIIYLGGLGELGSGLSLHLRSRREVELALARGGVPVTTFRAAMIIGSGSASFEILRYLVERLPVMVTPRWVSTRCQPVSVVDVLGYLMDCLDEPKTIGRCLEIGGPVILSYRELMAEMARQLGLPRRIVIPLPVLTPKLSSLWIGLITPVSPAVARPLAEGLRNEVIVHDKSADELMPRKTLAPSEAIEQSLRRVRDNDIPTRWTAAGAVPGDPDWAGGKVFTDRRTIRVAAPADAVFAAICRIGGGNGWYAADYLWRLRGFMDKVIGGPGLRRGRRHPETVEFGETLDFWRVIDVRPAERLALLAEMKLPGEATLTFDIEPDGNDQLMTMTARFRPKGLLGLAYWYAVLPLHHFVFRGMLRGIASAAESIASNHPTTP
jgi:uncharacterized protein YbjT (DUF2867 family)